MRPKTRAALAAGAVGVVGAVAATRARRAAPDVPFSPLTAGLRVGSDYAERRGIAGESLPGETDDLGAYARPGFDPDAVHPTVRAFYEETTDFSLAYRVRWHRGFRAGRRRRPTSPRASDNSRSRVGAASGGAWRATS